MGRQTCSNAYSIVPSARKRPEIRKAARVKTDDTAQHTTRWSLIVRAQGDGAEARVALGELLTRYERSVDAMVRWFGHPWNESPEDLRQRFFADIIRRDDIAKLSKGKGSFRAWLGKAVQNFMCNAWDTWNREKRGNRVTSPGNFQVEHAVTPEMLFMRQFAEDTLVLALDRHRELAANKTRFDHLVRFLPGPQLEISEHAPLAKALGIARGTLAVQLCRLYDRHKEILREVVADIVEVDPDDTGAAAIDIEMGEIYRYLCEVPPTRVILENA